jgi:peptidoglycan/LPS O-acetylase OafA/YrhL
MAMKLEQIYSLTATRGIAALMVVVFHFGCLIPPFNKAEHFFRNANLAVGYFFVLSGFVMFITYSRRQISYGSFLIKRFGRIGPAYLLGIILAIVVAHLYLQPMYDGEFVKKLLLNVFFLQAFNPGYSLTINSPGWSLSVEMFFYILFPALLIFARNHTARFIVFSIGIYIASQFVHLAMINVLQPTFPSENHELIYYHPIFHLNEFLIGITAGCIYQAGKWKKIRYFSLPLLILILLLINFGANKVSMHNGLLAPLYGLLLLGIAYKEPILLNNRVMLMLGKLSFAIYILQEPIYIWATNINKRHMQMGENTFFYFYLFVLIVASALSYYLLEEPVRKAINRAVDAHTEKAA